MHLTIDAVLDDDVTAGTVIGVLVCPGALTAFQHDGIIVHMHITAMNEHITAHIQVDGIRAGPTATGINRGYILCRRINETTQITYILTTVEMIRPERRVDNLHILNRHILRIRDIDITRAHRLHIGALGIILTANPEFLPVFLSVAVDGTWPRNREAIDTIGIHQCCKIVECLTFHTGLHNLKVSNTVGALQFPTLLYQKMRSRLKE